jgi:hypothetical protein
MKDRCDWVRARLERLLDGELPGEEQAQVEAHLATCDACRALLGSLRSADQAVRSGAVPGAGTPAEEEAFQRRWARFQASFDLTAVERQRAGEVQAGAGATTPMSGEEVAAEPLGAVLDPNALRAVGARGSVTPPADVPEPAKLVARVRAILAGWLAPRPVWRWASLAGAAVAITVITTVLITRNPEVRPYAIVGAQRLDEAPDAVGGQRVAKGPPGTEGQRAVEAPPGTEGQRAVEAPPGTEGQRAAETPRGEPVRAKAEGVGAAEIGAPAAPAASRGAHDLNEHLAQPDAAPRAIAPPGPAGPTWGEIHSLTTGLQPMAAGPEPKKATFVPAAGAAPPIDQVMLEQLDAAASELNVSMPPDLHLMGPSELAEVLVQVQEALKTQGVEAAPAAVSRSGEAAVPAVTSLDAARQSRPPVTDENRVAVMRSRTASDRDVAGAGETAGRSVETAGKGSNVPVAERERPEDLQRDEQVQHLATLWVTVGDGWFSLFAQGGPGAASLTSGSAGEPSFSAAHGREETLAAADSLAAKALAAYERALSLEPAAGTGEGVVPKYVTERVEVLRGWIKGAMAPAPASPASPRKP